MQDPFAWSFPFGRLFGVTIRVHILFPLVAVALILRNVWVWLHWQVLAERRGSGRRVDTNRLPFRAMLLWLQHWAEALLGVRDEIHAKYSMEE